MKLQAGKPREPNVYAVLREREELTAEKQERACAFARRHGVAIVEVYGPNGFVRVIKVT